MNPKLSIIFIFSLILIGVGAFVLGRTTSDFSIDRITSSPYEKCMYQCFEGKGESVSYCRPHIKDFIANYNKYYDPFSVSSAFEEAYIDKTKPVSQENGMMIACFRFIVGCRENLCKDYLNN